MLKVLLKCLNSFIENRIDVVFHLRGKNLQINFSYQRIPLTAFSGPFKTIPVVGVGVGVGKQVLIRLS